MKKYPKKIKVRKHLSKVMTKHLQDPDNHDYEKKAHNLKLHLKVILRSETNNFLYK